MSRSHPRRRSREDRERPLLEAFLRELGDAPPGRLHTSECPDFLFHQRRRRALGVEITELRLPASFRREAARELVHRRATLELTARLCHLADLRGLELRVAFSGDPPLDEASRGPVAKALAAEVRRWFGRSRDAGAESAGLLPPEVQSLEIRSLPGRAVRTTLLPPDPEPLVQAAAERAVEEKNRRLDAYLEQCDACWLVLAAGWDGRSRGPFVLEELGRESGSRFKRTFLLRTGAALPQGRDRLAS